ncbi:MAG TPA: prepilin-type N-terminal cleavage/methylation domain-containing protein [Tepidisphaeraceae bacterium]|nr:prepilin-type N-terminal cleavage/methylation domain-containing protein [Tepidisphaeraceae bacterium]
MRSLDLCRRRSNSRPHAFTLVEILIVVIILGILATVIIAAFQNSTKDAGGNALKENLRSMRSALEVYQAQHGSYPALARFESQMTQYTDGYGNTSATRSNAYPYGPYILTLPNLPVGTNRGSNTVTGTTYAAGFAWSFDATDGTFKANLPDADVDTEGKAYNTY